jgi:predicted nucleotidyltransferase
MAESEGGEREGRGVRLKAFEVEAIKTAARSAFGEDVVVRLFGSRVDDRSRGGDIDLHFETDKPIGDRDVTQFERTLFNALDEQKVDKIFTVRGTELSPFERICYRDGITL